MKMRKTKFMKKTNESGFTLIELLVVISIIGLLSTMAVISLGSAKAKARDAQRVSDVRQLVTLLSMAASIDPNQPLSGCINSNTASTTFCTGPHDVSQFSTLKDPSKSNSACVVGSNDVCQYAILSPSAQASAVNVASATVIFYLENGSAGMGKGTHTVSTLGVFN